MRVMKNQEGFLSAALTDCSFNSVIKLIDRKWGKPYVHFLISNNKENYENDSLRLNVSDNFT